MRVVFVGTVKFSKLAFKKVIENKVEVAGLVTMKNSTFNSDYEDLTDLAVLNNIPFHYTNNINSRESIDWIKEKQPDFIFCFGWSSLLKSELLKIPTKGVIGFHPAALPSNRGRHPLIWALVLGLTETASTFFLMDEGADSGPILNQKNIEITATENAKSLYDKVTNYALVQIDEFIPLLQNNSYNPKPQDQTKANYWRKRGKEDGKIDWRMNAEGIYNQVRALSKPYVGSHLIYKTAEVKIWEVKIGKCLNINFEPGKVLEVNQNSILVKCFNGAIEIVNHEFKQLPIKGEYL